MTVSAGSRLGPYEVVAAIGAGGMGEVYRASDTQLKRDVALKILPAAFAADPDRLARFRREAEVLASLNHPNIATIHGVAEGPTDTGHVVRALVLEFVDGPTLADRIAGGPLPLAETLDIARQIADALDAAHEHGVVHRDLKPSNIKLRPDGTVKVLDFGLAKALEPAGSHAGTSHVHTITSPAMTGAGAILGTAAYMSPEQARGLAVDRRADIWAFGCVLFEMLTGGPAFAGATVSDIIAKVLEREPDWGILPRSTPASVRRLLRRCLIKDPRRRLHDIADAQLELHDALDPRAEQSPSAVGGRDHRWLALAGAVCLAAGVSIAGTWWWLGMRRAPAPEVRLDIMTPETGDPASLAISPDGRSVVFVATSEGRQRLWLRPLDTTESRPLPGTDLATYPFWSPDSRSVAFFALNALKRIDIDGGSIQLLVSNVPLGLGGVWVDGSILYSATPGSPIVRIPESGGLPTPVTQITPSPEGHWFPRALPGGRFLLYYRSGAAPIAGVYVADISDGTSRRLLDADGAASYVPSGHLVFVRQGTLYAQRFDLDSLAVTGSAVPLDTNIHVDSTFRVAALSVSSAGSILYRHGSAAARRQFVWVDRSGAARGSLGDADDAGRESFALAPGGRRIVVSRTVDGNTDIWELDSRGIASRLTSHPGVEVFPVLSPDGTRLVFSSPRDSDTRLLDLYEKAATGVGSEGKLLDAATTAIPLDWSRDGRYLLYKSFGIEGSQDLWALPMQGDRTPLPVAQTTFDERDGQFSPDGRWVAYQSDRSGSFEIHVQPFPGPGPPMQVSKGGGAQVRWRADGQELYYIALDGRLTAVPMAFVSNNPRPGTPQPLFQTRVGGAVQMLTQQYAVAPDGLFLLNATVGDATVPMTLLLNWRPPAD